MKSVLLGGLKVWLVNDGGKPLSAPGGRAKFYTAGTSTPETVYSDIDLTDATAYGPSVDTDKLGYLPAIWLKTDRLYKVVVEQRIQEDPETWVPLWEVDNVGYIDPNESGESSLAPVTVNSLSELKALDYSLVGYALVLGYYEPGDWGEPSVFYWDPSCVKAPEDGAYVLPNDMQSTSPGRWRQVFDGAILDVRKFGALPDQTQNSDVQGKVVNAVAYSQENSTRSRPITVGFVAPGRYDFIGNFDFSQYKFTDISDNNTEYPVNWFFGEDVVLRNIGVSANTFTLQKNSIVLTKGALVEGTAALAIEKNGSIAVDPAWWGGRVCNLENCYVRCGSVTTNTKSFKNCTIDSNWKLGGSVTLNGCGFRQEWFASGFDWSHLTLVNAEYGVYDCLSANDYIAIKNSQGDNNYGDLENHTVSGVTLLDGAVLRNGFFDGVTIEGDSALVGISGTCLLSGSLKSHNWTDCDITITNSSGTLSISSLTLYCGELIADGTTPIIQNDLDIYDSKVKAGLYVRGKLVLERCKVYKGISHQCIGAGKIEERIVGCSFLEGEGGDEGRVNIESTGTDTLVKAVWTDNYSEVQNPILIDRTNIAADDTLHSYVYENNTGLFLPKKFTKTFENVVVDTPSGPITPAANTVYFIDAENNDPCLLTITNPTSGGTAWNEIKLFAVGSSEKMVKAVFYPPNSENYGSYAISQPLHLIAANISGFDYGLYSRLQSTLMHWVRYPTGVVPTTPIKITVDFEVM